MSQSLIIGMNQEKGEAVATRIEGMGGKAIFIGANVIDKKAVE